MPSGRPFTSGLSAADFAATLALGMRPVAFVQGCSVLRWHRYGRGSGITRPRVLSHDHAGHVLSNYDCPHLSPMPGHWTWGQNFEQTWKSQAWADGFSAAFSQMMDRAADIGAHGVLGVVDSSADPPESGVREFQVYGTAVILAGAESPERPWSCRLRGQSLAKMIEAGYWPVSALAAMASVRSWAVCSTKMLMVGDYDELANTPHRVRAGSPITQLADAQMQARRLARDRLADLVDSDTLFGVDLQVAPRQIRSADIEVECILRGSQVRRRQPGRPGPATTMVSLR